MHFISVILSERGLWDGKDSYPVFHLTPHSTLAHTVAKLCATRSHRMWIVDDPANPSPSGSVPPSPGLHGRANGGDVVQAHVALPPPTRPAVPGAGADMMLPHASPHPITPGVSVPAAQLPGANISGRLSGVVSLTDVLNLFARASGLRPGDPEELRRRRRGSSSASSTTNVRPSGEFLRRTSGNGMGGELGAGRRSSSRGSGRRIG